MRPSRKSATIAAAVALVVGTMGAAVAVTTITDYGVVDGIQYVTGEDSVTQAAPLTIDIPCSGTKQPTGGGFNGGIDELDTLRAAFPADLNGDGRIDGWRVIHETDQPSTAVGSGAHVVCRGVPLTYVVAKGSLPGEPGGLTLTATCPSNLHITGGGAAASGGAGAPHAAKVISSFPIDGPDVDAKPDDGWRARFFGTTQPGTKVFAICATTNQQYPTRTDSITGIGMGHFIRCPADRHVVGFGAKINGPVGEARVTMMSHLDALEFEENGDDDEIPDDSASLSFNNEFGDPKSGTGWAICAK